jgi:hypothetical protein
MVYHPKVIAKRKSKQVKTKMDWNRVEELLAEKLANRVRINIKIRENEENEDVDEDDVMESEFDQEDIDAELNTRELSFFFMNKHLNKINKVG